MPRAPMEKKLKTNNTSANNNILSAEITASTLALKHWKFLCFILLSVPRKITW